tara:strand:- start:114 stop:440 length:327 start_codon:yes stop_codon:yes gene_type:complete
MSINYTIFQDQMLMLLESVTSETDEMVRLQNLRKLKKDFVGRIRKEERKAAYEARMLFSSADVADSVGMDRKDLDYLVRVHLTDHPEKPSPKKRKRVDITNYLDLRVL